MGRVEVRNVSPLTWEKYLRGRLEDGVKPGTVNVEGDYLRAALRQGVAWGYIAAAPKIRHLPLPKERRPRVLGDDELVYILANVSDDHADALLIGIDTGMRLGELFSLTPKNVDTKRKMILLDDTKSTRPRDIPMTPRVEEILSRRFKAHKKRLFAEKSSARLSARFSYERRALHGVQAFRYHDTRHTFATKLLQGGTDPYTVMQLLGHSDLEMLTQYLHTNNGVKREAIKRISGDGKLTK
jgi:integrase